MEQNTNDFIMLPTVDFCFKELMQNPKVRKGFIAALLNVSPEKIKGTTLAPTILEKATQDDKLGILDVAVNLYDGTQIDIEMQILPFDCWEKRVLFYLSKMYIRQIHEGESYDKLKKCIHVSVLNFIQIPDDECYHTINLRDERTGEFYTDLFELKILELPKFPPKGNSDQKSDEVILHWMQFFNAKTKEEFETVAKKDEYIDEAYQTLLNLSADEQKMLEYEARQKAIRDHMAWMSTAENRGLKRGMERGLERGLEQGLEQGLIQGEELKLVTQVCKKMKRNYSVPEIADMLEEEPEVIQRIYDAATAFAPDYDTKQIMEKLNTNTDVSSS